MTNKDDITKVNGLLMGFVMLWPSRINALPPQTYVDDRIDTLRSKLMVIKFGSPVKLRNNRIVVKQRFSNRT